MYEYLTTANDTSEWMWKIYFRYAATIIISEANLALISALYWVHKYGVFDVDHTYRAVRMVYAISEGALILIRVIKCMMDLLFVSVCHGIKGPRWGMPLK